MADARPTGPLSGWYDRRIGTPTTADEVNGYWLFVAGVLLGIAGIALFFGTASATGGRGIAYALAALATPFIMLGAIIRFPLQTAATYIGYAGAAASFIAVVWFVAIFPDGWFTAGGNTEIIGLYSLGILLIGLAGTIIPLLTAPVEADDSVAAEQAAATATAHEAELSEARERTEELEQQVATLQAEADDAKRSLARFELFTDKRGEHRWRLRHRNGNIIADSSEGYTAIHNAQKGMQSVRRNALGAGILRIEPEPDADSDPVPADADDPVVAVPAAADEIESKATFEQFTDKRGEFRWRLRHDNGNIIADSGEGYNAKSGVTKSIERLRTYVAPADYLWFDPTGFEVYRDAADEWRWRLIHRNGEILGDSGEGYSRRHDATRAVDRLRTRIDDLDFEVYEDAGGEFRWRLVNANGEILGDSGEGYASKNGADEAVERVQRYAPEADTLDIGTAAFELYEDKGGEYRWRLRHRNGNILADCGEGYTDRSSARDGIESVKRNAPGAATEQAD